MAKASKKRSERVREPSQPRNTFRAAQARREAREALPDVLFTPRKEVKRAQALNLSSDDGAGDYRGNVPEQSPEQKKSAPLKRRDDLGVSNPDAKRRDEALRGCKSKPKSSKGNGTSRPFIPWCKS